MTSFEAEMGYWKARAELAEDARRVAIAERDVAAAARGYSWEAVNAIREKLNYIEEERENLQKKAHVMHDLHDALGVKWGEDPYARISELRKTAATRVLTVQQGHLILKILRVTPLSEGLFIEVD